MLDGEVGDAATRVQRVRLWESSGGAHIQAARAGAALPSPVRAWCEQGRGVNCANKKP